THLRVRHSHLKPEERRSITTAVGSVDGLLQKRAELVDFAFPEPATAPIPYLDDPQPDGLQCRECRYISRQLRNIQQHCRERHGWQNPNKRGRPTGKASEPVPWVEGVQCQRFFPSRQASGWFEVGRGETPQESSEAGETIEQRLVRVHQEQVARFFARVSQIQVPDEKNEPNPWLRRVGWAEHLQGLDREQLRTSIRPVEDGEVVLQQVWQSCERVLEQAKAAAIPQRVGYAALFEINRNDAQVKSKKPFDSRMEDDTWARYKEVMRKLVCYVLRTKEWDERPQYEMTHRQKRLVDQVVTATEDNVQDGTQGGGLQCVAADRICLDMMVEFFDHALKDSHYESVIISGLAVMGIREDGGWVPAQDYTQIYSAVIKVLRLLVVYQAVTERDEQVAAKERVLGRQEARDAVPGVFRMVRAKVQRFMVLVSSKSEPSPVDWIFDARTYGLKIRYTTAANGSIDWQGDQVTYQRIKMTMSQLADMLHGLVDEAKVQLGQLVMADDWPAIPWTLVEDDHSEDRVGYSFLQDDRNTWVCKGAGWVVRQIVRQPAKQAEWLSSDSTNTCPYRPTAVRRYRQQFEEFRELLLMLMHMAGGQPGRAPELIGIRHSNTANGGVRNVFAHQGMMCFVTVYHKNYQSSEQVKIIHRYLPREVGELLVWYLWLVLPFWQEVEGMVKEGDDVSAFMWDDEVVRKDRSQEGGDKEDGEEEVEYGAEAQALEEGQLPMGSSRGAVQQWFRARRWTADRMRRIMHQHSARHIGHRVGISAWRQIAVGISNRYLNKAFGQSTGWEGDEDDNEMEDSPYDLQAGHGTHVAGMVYARELQQGTSGTAARREQFRAVSRQWHRF
ncbi:MAG: hypothetical protein JWP34_5031, partial [Massilia sp.]|nr:hypothetical protein [Massilia sp.]